MTQPSEEFLALLAHELRTPISAIIGYHDLMSEGILGDVDPRIAESVQRIRSSADQLLTLVASLGEAASDADNLHVEVDTEDPRAIIDHVLQDLQSEASGRFTNVVIDRLPDPQAFDTDSERLERALLLTLHAAIKNTAGGEIHVDVQTADDIFSCTVTGARFDVERESIDRGVTSARTAAAMRLAMARHAVLPLGGTVALGQDDNGATVTVRVPASRLT
jgi:two-component system, chemotaxis family, CheB/CheR fusion protein